MGHQRAPVAAQARQLGALEVNVRLVSPCTGRAHELERPIKSCGYRAGGGCSLGAAQEARVRELAEDLPDRCPHLARQGDAFLRCRPRAR